MQRMEKAMMRPRLAVTLPTALPTAMSAFPCAAAMADTSSSGRVVARLTMVAPTISLGIPLTSAIQEAASTNQSPPFTIRMIPARKIMPSIANSISCSPFFPHTFAPTLPRRTGRRDGQFVAWRKFRGTTARTQRKAGAVEVRKKPGSAQKFLKFCLLVIDISTENGYS